MSRLKLIVLPAMAGAMVSSVVTIGLASLWANDDKAKAVEAPAERVVEIVREPSQTIIKHSDGQQVDLSEVYKRLDLLEKAQGHVAESEPATGAGASDLELYQERYDAVIRQPLDPVWAPKAEKNITEHLERFSKQLGFEVSEVSCRGDSCVVSTNFPNYGKASESARALAGLPYAENCETFVSALEPDDPHDPYSMDVILSGCQKK